MSAVQLGAFAWGDRLTLFAHFLTLSLLAVGGAITAVPETHRFLVSDKHWLGDGQFSASIALAQAALVPISSVYPRRLGNAPRARCRRWRCMPPQMAWSLPIAGAQRSRHRHPGTIRRTHSVCRALGSPQPLPVGRAWLQTGNWDRS
jgi:hypothetical protein